MNNQNAVRGGFLAVLALFFGFGALRHPLGDLSRAGPGLFPLLVSAMLLVLALLMLVQARLSGATPVHFNIKNITVILLALAGFVTATKVIDMAAGIIVLVFVAGSAAASYSWKRNLKISIGLIIIALVFDRLLGLNLKVL